jgi:hypothetical protein
MERGGAAESVTEGRESEREGGDWKGDSGVVRKADFDLAFWFAHV